MKHALQVSRLASTLTIILGLSVLRAFGFEVYVSPDGSDQNPGTRARPFRSLERARDAVRELPKTTANRAITIWLASGDYFRTNALELEAQDSGGPGGPVVWRAEQPGQARILGARQLRGLRPVSDPAVRSRLADGARDHIREVDLRNTLDAAPALRLESRGFGRAVRPAHCEVFYGGKPMTLARWPNEGEWEQIAGFPKAGEEDGHGGKTGALADGFQYSGNRPERWGDPTNVWVHGYWSWDWANSYERVAALDTEKRLIRTAPPHGLYGFRKGQRFHYLNILEELDTPGEWFLDSDKGRLYFWPPAEQAGASSPELLLSITDQPFVKFNGASNIVIRGITFEGTRAAAIEVRAGADVRIAGCTIRNIGNYAVTVSGGKDHSVVSCNIRDTGDGGVNLSGGDRRTLTPGNHSVENCYFTRIGRWSKCYVPAVMMSGVGLRASHNLIHDHPHCAILFNGNDHLIDFNEIHHIALETGDVGAIYTGRDYTYRGNRIRNNYIHHTGGVGMGSMGVYMDDCVSGTEISGNIFYKVQRAAFLGGGRDHRVFNNIFVDCNHAVELDGRGLDKSPVWSGMVDKTMRGRLGEVPLELYRARYPEMKSLDAYYGAPGGAAITGTDFKGVPPENNLAGTNVVAGKWLNVYWHAKPAHLQLHNNLTNAVTSFARPPTEAATARDFELKADSPAWALGFQRIPTESIGLVRDEFRQSIPE